MSILGEFIPCCSGDWLIKTGVGSAWNAGFHAAGGWVFSRITAAITGSSEAATIANMTAAGTAVLGAATGFIRSGLMDHHFGVSGLNELYPKLHFLGETTLSTLTTFIGAPLGKQILGLENQISTEDTLGSSGWPSLTVWGMAVVGTALKHLYDEGYFGACCSWLLCSNWSCLPNCCPSLGIFSLFSRNDRVSGRTERDLEAQSVSRQLAKFELESRANDVMSGRFKMGSRG